MSNALLAVDIGNTNITFGLFHKNKLVFKSDVPTKKFRSAKMLSFLRRFEFKEAIICSVVPRATKDLSNVLAKISGRRPFILGETLQVPIKNLYRKPTQAGPDRLVNAFAGITLYKAPLIVIDFGTAITFDCVTKNREFLGGVILPGLEMALESLAEKTALLPKVELKAPREIIGRNTKNSVLSGIVFGFSLLTDAMIEKIKKQLGKNTKVVSTGGNCSLIAKYSKEITCIDKNLTLKGLNLIYALHRHASAKK